MLVKKKTTFYKMLNNYTDHTQSNVATAYNLLALFIGCVWGGGRMTRYVAVPTKKTYC